MRLACAQWNVAFDDPETNVARAAALVRNLHLQKVDLVVFPEAFATGYCVSTAITARAIAIPDSALDPLRRASDETGVLVVTGYARQEPKGQMTQNAAALFEPGCEPRVYVKTHLPFLGMDRFCTPGNQLALFDTRLGKIGVMICYDMRFPEVARCLALAGADLILIPTNWPDGAQVSAEHVVIARAAENGVFVASCNRVGTENGFAFIGRSKIVSPSGKVLASAGSGEEVIVADLDFAEARQKRRVLIPGEYEVDPIGDRRPEMYKGIV